MRHHRALGVAVAAAVALGLGACGGEEGDEEAYCATARELGADGGLADGLAEVDPTDAPSTGDALRATATRLRAWADDAPGGRGGDIEVMAAAADALADAVLAGGSRSLPAPARAELEELSSSAEAASAEVASDVAERCDVQLDVPPSTESTTTTVPPASAPGG